MAEKRDVTALLRDAPIKQLLTSVAEPDTPEERDAAWNEIARRDARYQRFMDETIDPHGGTRRDLERIYG